MSGIYLSLVFLFAWEIRNVYSSRPSTEGLDLTGGPSRNPTPQPIIGLSLNPCDTATFEGTSRDSHLPCHKECLSLKSIISKVYTVFPGYKLTQYLYNKCGMATAGWCSKAVESPICWCHSREKSGYQQRHTLSSCRSGIRLMRNFAKTMATLVQQAHIKNLLPNGPPSGGASPTSVSRLGSSIPPCRPEKEPIASPSGNMSPGALSPKVLSPTPTDLTDDDDKCLYTNVGIDGQLVQVVVDTGAATCIIPPKYAKNVVPAGAGAEIYGAGDQHSFQILGTTTINITVGKGATIPLTGKVVARGVSEILLGSDFFVAWAAKITISEGTMELSVGLSKVKLRTQFLNRPTKIQMISSRGREYTPLLITARVSGFDTKVYVDTGSGATIVSKNMVWTKIRPVHSVVSFAGSEPESWLGIANVNFRIGHNSMDIPAYVPHFIMDADLLLGNDFIPKYVEFIDYGERKVVFKFPYRGGDSMVIARMLVIQDE